jgi:hydroxymethylpyrimidine/phosphomethylpyrimidine kinase
MLANGAIAEAVADMLDSPRCAGIPLILDTVMSATAGGTLLDPAGVDALRRRLIPRAFVVTPNLPEAAALTGLAVCDTAGMERAADALQALGARNVLLKGGHLEGDALLDLLVGSDGRAEFPHARIASRHIHGTGCTLASAIATLLAQGVALEAAAGRAILHVQAAIRAAPGFGRGNGPLGPVGYPTIANPGSVRSA